MQVLQGDEAVAGILVTDHGVAMKEGAAATVLSRDADGEVLVEQGGIGHALGEAPVHQFVALRHLIAIVQDLLDPSMHLEMAGRLGDMGAQHL